jgi:hypothetical protein
MGGEVSVRRATDTPTPGVVLVIRHASAVPAPIDITPKPAQIIDAGEQ